MGYFLKDAIKGIQDINNYSILLDGYNFQNIFYIKILQDKGLKVTCNDYKNLMPGNLVISYQNNIKNYLKDHYLLNVINENGQITRYKILDKKP